MTRDPVPDWHIVPQHQLAMHERLLNWARWCRGAAGSTVSPMFRLYRSTDAKQGEGMQYGLRPTANPVDAHDAVRVQRGVGFLPEPHRMALSWYYVRPVSPRRACQEIGTTFGGLATLVAHGRQMLINRRA